MFNAVKCILRSLMCTVKKGWNLWCVLLKISIVEMFTVIRMCNVNWWGFRMILYVVYDMRIWFVICIFLVRMRSVLLRKGKMMKHNFLFCISLLHCSLQFAPHISPATTRANLSVFVLFSMKLFSSSLPGNGTFHNKQKWLRCHSNEMIDINWSISLRYWEWMLKNVFFVKCIGRNEQTLLINKTRQ